MTPDEIPMEGIDTLIALADQITIFAILLLWLRDAKKISEEERTERLFLRDYIIKMFEIESRNKEDRQLAVDK